MTYHWNWSELVVVVGGVGVTITHPPTHTVHAPLWINGGTTSLCMGAQHAVGMGPSPHVVNHTQWLSAVGSPMSVSETGLSHRGAERGAP